MQSNAVPLASKRKRSAAQPTLRAPQGFLSIQWKPLVSNVNSWRVAGGELSWEPDGPWATVMRAAVRKRKVPIYFFQPRNGKHLDPTIVLSHDAATTGGNEFQRRSFAPSFPTTVPTTCTASSSLAAKELMNGGLRCATSLSVTSFPSTRKAYKDARSTLRFTQWPAPPNPRQSG